MRKENLEFYIELTVKQAFIRLRIWSKFFDWGVFELNKDIIFGLLKDI